MKFLNRFVRSKAQQPGVGVNLPAADAANVSILSKALLDAHPGVAIYALNTLEEIAPAMYTLRLPLLLSHPNPQVRQEALRRIEHVRLMSALPALKNRLTIEKTPEVHSMVLRALAVLGDREVIARLSARLHDRDGLVRRSAISGLLRSGDNAGAQAATQKLAQMAASSDATERVASAQLFGEVGLHHLRPQMVALLRDPAPAVRRMALRSAGKLQQPDLWALVMAGLTSASTRKAAMAALVSGSNSVLGEVGKALYATTDPDIAARLAVVCGRIGGADAIALLISKISANDVGVRTQVARALSRCKFHAEGADAERMRAQVKIELVHAAWLAGAINDVSSSPAVALLKTALEAQLTQCGERILRLLACVHDAHAILRARENLLLESAEKKAAALQLLTNQLEPELSGACLALFDDLNPRERLIRLTQSAPQSSLGRELRLQELVQAGGKVSGWVVHCAQHAIDILAGKATPGNLGGKTMLSLIEKVIILKTAPIFAETPDEVLADVARILEEVEVGAGDKIIEKGEAGDSLYLVASGQVRVHDGDHTLNMLGEGQEFGETALLDPGPRSASVTASEDTLLLRLDQMALYELMEDRSEISRGIIRVLTRFLRERLHDLSEIRNRTEPVTAP